jgi:hypothetical protein
MPTVIDSLVIEVGLDPKKFTQGQKEAIKSFSDAKDAAKRVGNDIEDIGKRSSEFLGVLQTRLLGVTSLIVGGLGIDHLVGQMLKQDEATGRLAYTLGTSTKELDKWRNAAYIAGGSSQGITNFITGLTDEWGKLAATGQSSLIPFFQGLGVPIADVTTNQLRPFEDVIKDVADKVSKMNPQLARFWLKSIGADEDTINLIIRGRGALEDYLAAGEKFGTLAPKQAEAARQLGESYRTLSVALTEFSRTVLTALTPAIAKIEDFFAKSINDRNRTIPKTSIFGRFMDYMGLYKDESKATADNKTGTSAFPGLGERIAYYREQAAKRGMDPNVIESVVRSEGALGYKGDNGSSFGDFQLHYGGVAGGGNAVSGLGDAFTKKTGLNARDPSTWKQQADFSLDQMQQGGLSPWHGWKGGPWQGIPRGGASTSSTDIKIQSINIYPPNGDSDSIASSIGPAIKRNSLSYQGQGGPQ